MALRIPLQAVSNQTLTVTVARQAASIALRQNGASLYFDLSVNGVYMVRSRICRNIQRLLLDAQYRGFIGDFMFIDTQAPSDSAFSGSDPQFEGLGDRYQLIYLAAGE